MIGARLARLVTSRSVVSGALLYVAMRWFDRLVGVISTVVLARLLTPDDFGVVALASIALGLAVVMLDLGIQIAVVQRPTIDRDEIDTAWTLRLLQDALVAAVLAATAHWVSRYYDDARLEPVLYVLAIGYLLEGFTGMGPVVFQKRQQYAREVAFFVSKRLGGFVVTLVLAIWLRNYWALVLGSVLASAWGVMLSHGMYRVRPRFTFVRWHALVGASMWVMLRSVGTFAGSQLDKIVIGRRDGPTSLGAYSIADQIAAMPTSELLAPMSRALFPALVAIQDDAERLRRAYLYALGIQSVLALPASIGLALVAEELVGVMLGDKWHGAVPILSALAFAYGATALTHSGNYLMFSLGKFRAQAILQWGLFAALALMVLVVYPHSGAEQIAWLRVALSGASIVAIAYLTRQYLPSVTVGDMVRAALRPAAASLLMAGCVLWVANGIRDLPVWLALAVKVSVGAAVYTGGLLLMWHLRGRPDGAERWLVDRIASIIESVRLKAPD